MYALLSNERLSIIVFCVVTDNLYTILLCKVYFYPGLKKFVYEEERMQESEDGECYEQLSSRQSMPDASKN